MSNITVRDIPEAIYQKIKENAIANKRSINSEILYGLEQNYGKSKQDKKDTINQMGHLRAKTQGRIYLIEADIAQAKNE